MTKEEIKKLIKKYDFETLKLFISNYLPIFPIPIKHKAVKVRTLDNFTFIIWGKDYTDILEHFNNFLKVRLFL